MFTRSYGVDRRVRTPSSRPHCWIRLSQQQVRRSPFALAASAFAAPTRRYDQLHDMFSKYGCIYEIGIKYNEGLFGASSIAYSTIK